MARCPQGPGQGLGWGGGHVSASQRRQLELQISQTRSFAAALHPPPPSKTPRQARLALSEGSCSPLGRGPSLLLLIIVILTALLTTAVITGISASVSPGSVMGHQAPGGCGGGRCWGEVTPGAKARVGSSPAERKRVTGPADPSHAVRAPLSFLGGSFSLPPLLPPPPGPFVSFSDGCFPVSSGVCIFRPKLRSRADPRLDRRLGFPWAPCCPPETWGGLGGPGLSRRLVVLPGRRAWHWEGVLVGP